MMVDGWQLIQLGEILKERCETPSQRSIETGEINIVSKIGFSEGKIELRNEVQTKTRMILIRPGDLVISGINAVKGAIAIYSETARSPIAATIHYSAYIPDKEHVDIRYLWWFLRSAVFKGIVQDHIPGGIKTELRAKKFLVVPIPLPPLTEQRRIVARIEALAERVAAANRLRLDATTETKQFQDRIFDAIIENGTFELKPLGSVISEPLQNGLSIPASGIGEVGILFAKVGIVNSGKMNPKEVKRVNIELPKNSNFCMKLNDIFISRGNSLELVGRAAVYEGEPENCAFPDLLIRIRVDKNIIDPHYLVYYFHSKKAREYIERVASGTSPSMKKVSQPKLERMEVPLPSIEEQHRIVLHMNKLQMQVSALRAAQAETERELAALMPSILDRAFKGDL